MRRWFIITRALLVMQLRNKMTLFWNLLFPLFLLVIYALVFGQEQMGGAAYVTWILPGVVVLNILSFGLLGSASTMVEMRERGVLRRLQATPVSAAGLLGAYLSVNLLLCLLQSLALVAAAVLALGFRPAPSALLLAVPTILMATLLSLAMGQVVSGVAVKAGLALALGQTLYFSQMFITDLVVPLDLLPPWLQAAAVYLPGYSMVQLVRPPLLNGTWPPNFSFHLALTLGYIAVTSVAAALLFRWAPKA
jgi:ABC-2 type transport system permease protein